MTTRLDSKAAEKLADNLDAIPALFADLPAVKTGIKNNNGGAHTPPASKPPLSIEVVTLLDTEKKDADEYQETDPRDRDVLDRYGVIPRLGLWLRIAIEQMTNAGEHVPDIDGWMNLDTLCRSLSQVTSWVITQQWATAFAADMSALRAEIEAALGIAKEFKPRCRELWCGTLLDAMDNGSWYSCPGCKREYIIAEDLKALGDAQYLRDEEIAQLLDVPRSTVRYWKQVGWVHAIATTASGVLLYDLDQVRIVRDTPPAERVRP